MQKLLCGNHYTRNGKAISCAITFVNFTGWTMFLVPFCHNPPRHDFAFHKTFYGVKVLGKHRTIKCTKQVKSLSYFRIAAVLGSIRQFRHCPNQRMTSRSLQPCSNLRCTLRSPQNHRRFPPFLCLWFRSPVVPKTDMKWLRQKNKNFSRNISHGHSAQPVAYLGYGRHSTCHGSHFDGGAKIAWQKLKSWFTVSWTSILHPMHS